MARTPREISLKSILVSASGNKVSPAVFLDAHREFLLASGFSSKAKPIYEGWSSGKLFPTNALNLLRRELADFVKNQGELESEAKRVLKEEKARLKEELEAAEHDKNPAKAPAPKYEVFVKDDRGFPVIKGYKKDKEDNDVIDENGDKIPVYLEAKFDKYQDAERWAARRLVDSASDAIGFSAEKKDLFSGIPGYTAEIHHPLMKSIAIIDRNRAQEVLFPKRAGNVNKVKRPSGGLNISMCNVKGSDHCHFSHGLRSLILST